MNQLPTGWARARLEEVASGDPHALAIGPFGSSLKVSDYRGTGVPLVFVRNVRSEDFDRIPTFVDEQKAHQLRAHRVIPGDVLITKMGDPPGDTALYPRGRQEAILTADCIKVTPNSEVSGEYLKYAIRTPRCADQIAEMTSGVAQQKVSLAKIRGLEVPLAPAAEQARIVAAIEEAFSLLHAGETALHNTRTRLKRMRDSVLTAAVTGQLVPQDPTDTPADKLIAELGVGPGVPDDQLPEGWTWIALGDILRSIEAGKSFAAGGRPADKGELGVIKVSAMTWGAFRASENKVLPAGTTIDPRWIVREGDVLLSRANTTEYVGACVLVPRDYPNLILSDKSLRLVPERGINQSWLVHTLRARACRRQIEALATGTKESMRNISQDKLRGIRIALPPPEEQVRIVAEVERQFSFIEAAERAVASTLGRSAGLRRSVLKAAFEGRLVEQDPADEPASVLLARIDAERAATAPRKGAPGRVRGKAVAS